MIFPIFKGILPPYITPATWFLVLMNCVIFFANLPVYVSAEKAMTAVLHDTEFLRVQGAVFAQTVQRAPASHSPIIRKLADQATKGDVHSQMVIGGLSTRNHKFMKSALDEKIDGDEVAIKRWHERFYSLFQIQKVHPTYQWGLSAERSEFKNWLSYQFAHSGFEHLIFNMLFLMIFGTLLEARVGSALVILLYLGAGFAGAAMFVVLSGLTHSPLIGASGAVSGFMACIAVYLWSERIRFFYWLSPKKEHYGFQNLPAWLVVVAFLVPDLAGQLASVPDASGVAYGAHLGGAFFGATFAVALKIGWLEADPSLTEDSGLPR